MIFPRIRDSFFSETSEVTYSNSCPKQYFFEHKECHEKKIYDDCFLFCIIQFKNNTKKPKWGLLTNNTQKTEFPIVK